VSVKATTSVDTQLKQLKTLVVCKVRLGELEVKYSYPNSPEYHNALSDILESFQLNAGQTKSVLSNMEQEQFHSRHVGQRVIIKVQIISITAKSLGLSCLFYFYAET